MWHHTQNSPGFGPWGFDSPSRHHFKVITVCYHSRVGKTTTEVAFGFRSVVLEPNIRNRNFRLTDKPLGTARSLTSQKPVVANQ